MDKLLEKFKLNNKKGIENLVIFLVLVVIVMIVINSLFEEEERELVTTTSTISLNEKKDNLETRLENILSTLSGVGKVNVMVSYTNSIEKVPLYDTKETTTVTEETDSQGGKRKTEEINNEYTVVYEEG